MIYCFYYNKFKDIFDESKDKLVIKTGVHFSMIKYTDAPKGYNLMSNIQKDYIVMQISIYMA